MHKPRLCHCPDPRLFTSFFFRECSSSSTIIGDFQLFVVPLGDVFQDCCILGSIRIPPSHGNFRMANGGSLAPSRTFKWLLRIEDLGVFVHQPFEKFSSIVPRSHIIADLHSRNPCASSGSHLGCRVYGLGLCAMVPPRIPIKNHA